MGFSCTKLKELRKLKKLSIKRLSTLANIPYTTIWDIENRNKQPRLDTVARLSTALGVEPEWFYISSSTCSTLPEEMDDSMRMFLLQKDSLPYIRISQTAKEKGIPPEFLEYLTQTWGTTPLKTKP